MKDFPTAFVDKTTPLGEDMLSLADAALLKQLAEKGYEIHVGLTENLADQISQMCLQPSIKEYCPNDSAKRFTNRATTEKWLSKGRAAFLLLKSDTKSLAGYGWAGPATSPQVPGGEVTFAIRVGEADQGKGLSTPFLRLIIAGTAALYVVKNVWLETWASDGAAVHIYHKIGCTEVNRVDDKRSTATGEAVADTRIYMKLPNELL